MITERVSIPLECMQKHLQISVKLFFVLNCPLRSDLNLLQWKGIRSMRSSRGTRLVDSLSLPFEIGISPARGTIKSLFCDRLSVPFVRWNLCPRARATLLWAEGYTRAAGGRSP